MKKIGVFYWPKGGNVEYCAKMMVSKLGNFNTELYSLDSIKNLDLPYYDLVIVGGSTAGADIWQNADDNNLWFDFYARLEGAHLNGKPVAFFGLGDQVLYPDHFVDGMAIMKNEFDRIGAKIIGYWPTNGYDFTGSASLEGDKFIGLVLDEDQQPELTGQRIEKWISQILKEAGF